MLSCVDFVIFLNQYLLNILAVYIFIFIMYPFLKGLSDMAEMGYM